MIGHRRAAVAIHQLVESDRRWILDALPSKDQLQLNQYLVELDELGFTSEASEAVGQTYFEVRSADNDSAAKRLLNASAVDMFAILQTEPSFVIAQILALQDWPWLSDCLRMFNPTRRARIAAMAEVSTVQGRMRKQFLLDACDRRLQSAQIQRADLPVDPSHPMRVMTLLRPITHWMASWTR